MTPSSIVVIGASFGGVAALRRLVAPLEREVPAAWCVVLHIDSHESAMPEILQRSGSLPASHVCHGEQLQAGHIYVAPPDLHFLVGDGHALLSRGPRENWTRPAVDPLLRSAACSYGPQAIGVVLTGALDDGTAGLIEIKRHCGIAVVQDPDDAECRSMPQSALRHVAVDHCVGLAEMPSLLMTLVGRMAERDHLSCPERENLRHA